MDLQPFHIVPAANLVGEGILWDARRRRLLWTDIPQRRLFTLDWEGGAVSTLEMPERLGSFGLVHEDSRLIAAFASGIALYEPQGGAIEWLARPCADASGVRFNDGRVDRRCRLRPSYRSRSGRAQGALYCAGAGGQVRSHLQDIRISNSLCMSPDGGQLYFADTPTRTIRAFELIEPEGRLGAGREFARTPDGAYPDGATVDADGCLWSAHWGGGCVVRYTPEGRIDRTIRIPTRQPSCVCFAGPDLDILCVTSAREDLDEAALLAEPHAGDVFFYRVGTRGLAEVEYRP